MAPVPPPESPCLRVRLIYNTYADRSAGSRFYLSYEGTAPTAGNCSTLAADIGAAWETNLAPVVNDAYGLAEVDVIDIATDAGSSGQSTTGWSGSRSGTTMPDQCATNIEYDIARRYRGGKPRMYLPPGSTADQANPSTWSGTFVGEVNTAIAAFFTEIEALTVGAVGALAHVNLSYYNGYSTTTPPWRGPGFKYPPKYRAAALLDTVNGYATKPVTGSQKRRRTSTTP